MYFSRLELEPDEAIAAEATQLADQAIEAARGEGMTLSRGDVPALALMLDRLAARHAGAAVDNEEVQRLARLYGSLLGENVRTRVGGAWGIGRMFGEEVRGGLLIGYIKLWPWIEVRDRITGRATMPLVERIDGVCTRAAAADDDTDDEDDEPERLYPLKAGEGYFDVGVTRDGRLAMMAAFYPATFAIFFAADGTCDEYVGRPNETHAPNKEALLAWQTELGFTPQTIRVKRFQFSGHGLGIDDLTGYDDDFLDDPDSEADADERAARFASIRVWIDSGSFVLYWGNDLWLDGNGHVTSS